MQTLIIILLLFIIVTILAIIGISIFILNNIPNIKNFVLAIEEYTISILVLGLINLISNIILFIIA